MSRPSSPSGATASGGVAAGGVAGRVALRMPSGDPALLRARASGLRGIEAQARQTPLMRGAMAQRLPQVWAGVAADAAVAESTLLVGRAARVLDALPAASAALIRYAATLEQVRTNVVRLQREWDDETAAHTRAVVTTRSQAVVDVAAAQAVARLTDEHEAVNVITVSIAATAACRRLGERVIDGGIVSSWVGEGGDKGSSLNYASCMMHIAVLFSYVLKPGVRAKARCTMTAGQLLAVTAACTLLLVVCANDATTSENDESHCG